MEDDFEPQPRRISNAKHRRRLSVHVVDVAEVEKSSSRRLQQHMRSLAFEDWKHKLDHGLSMQEKEWIRTDLEKRQRLACTRCVQYSIIAFVCWIIANEILYYFTRDTVEQPSSQCQKFELGPLEIAIVALFEFGETTASVMLLYWDWQYHLIKNEERCLEKHTHPSTRVFNLPIFLELLACFIHSPPFLYRICIVLNLGDIVVPYSANVVGLAILIRAFLIPRLIRCMNRLHTNHARVVTSMFNFPITSQFSFKDAIARHTTISLGSLYIMTLLISSYIVLVLERPAHPQFGYDTNYFQTLWCMWAVMTTIGLGDWVPMSPFGRVACVCASFAGILLSTLLLSTLSISLRFTYDEEKVVHTMEKMRLGKKRPRLAANLIINWWKKCKGYRGAIERYSKAMKNWKVFKKDNELARGLNNLGPLDSAPYILDMHSNVKELWDISQQLQERFTEMERTNKKMELERLAIQQNSQLIKDAIEDIGKMIPLLIPENRVNFGFRETDF